MPRALSLTLAALLVAYSSVAAANLPPNRPVRGDAIDSTRQTIAYATQQARDKEVAKAVKTFEKAVASTGFAQLPESERYRAWVTAAAAANVAGDPEKALDWSTRACAFPAASSNLDLWQIRLDAAYQRENYADSARSVAMIARHWPKAVDAINVIAVDRIMWKLAGDRPHANEQFDLLDALFDTGWTNNGQQPSWRWLQLAGMWLDRGNLARATTVAARIDYPHAIVALRADKRYDRIPRTGPTTFDIERAKVEYAARAEERARAHPKQLEYSVSLQYAMLETMQPERALGIADEIITKVGDSESSGKKLYDDSDEYYLWILDNRAVALWRLGREDEAIEQQRRAARRPEHGGLNVSQALNLGAYYAKRGETDKALDAIADLGLLSPYGRMQREYIGVIDAIQRHDDKKLAAHLDDMRTHADDAKTTYLTALLDANRLDEAAVLLIDRLRDTDTRSDALVDMQQYVAVPEPPLMQTQSKRWRSVIARPDVQAALAPIGRIEQVALNAPGG